MDLAEEGGFEAVRLRDVAAHAQVALGTVYKRFRSKEDMLVAALALQVSQMERLTSFEPPIGDSPLERVDALFTTLTQALVRRPNFSRAVLRAVASGEPALADKVLRFHSRTTAMISAALRGTDDAPQMPADHALMMARMLQQIWFAALVGWMGGLHDPKEAIRQVHQAARLVMAGLESLGAIPDPPADSPLD